MTTTAPVGWPAHRPGLAQNGPSPEPVGWQGVALTAVEVAVDTEPAVADVSDADADLNRADVTADAGVSRETATVPGGHAAQHVASTDAQLDISEPEAPQAGDATPTEAEVEDGADDDRADTEQAYADPVDGVKGYDILLGGVVVSRETPTPTDDAVSDGPGVGDAATTVASAAGATEPAGDSSSSGPLAEPEPSTDDGAQTQGEALADATAALDEPTTAEADEPTTAEADETPEAHDTYVPRHHALTADDEPDDTGAVSASSGDGGSAALTDSVGDAAPTMPEREQAPAPEEAKAMPDHSLGGHSLPSRKARRAGRPRVPSFERVTETDWQTSEWAEDERSAPDASPRGDELPASTHTAAPIFTPEDGVTDHVTDAAAPQETTKTGPAETDAGVIAAQHVTDEGGAAGQTPAPQPRRVTYTSAERLPRPTHPRVLTVANQKGGVGKTTTTVNVAAALAQAGLKVLVIDIDPQGNASTALGIDHHSDVPSVYDVIVEGTPLADVMAECPDIPGLWCAPATIDLAGAEIELVSLVARESRLHRAINASLAAASDDERFDYVFIDCPPSLGLLTVNAFVAADEVFIPIQCEYYALEGLSQLLKNIEMIKMHLNPGLHVSTILLTMYDGRTNLSSQVADEVRTHFPDQVLGALVPRSVRISEAPSHGETVMTYDPSSTGALSYRDAAREIALRGAQVPQPSGRIGR